MKKKFSAGLAIAAFLYLGFLSYQLSKSKLSDQKNLKVLSYSSFLSEWGPGKELAELFEKQTGIKVEYQDGDDAGVLLTKLALFPSDVVLGLDQVTVRQAAKKFQWREPSAIAQNNLFEFEKFIAFDWAPLSFIYRTGEVEPPKNIDDLLSSRFKNAISLEDPRTSAPGLQFLFWLVAVKGEKEAFEFLQKLKPNIRAVSPSWSTAYGLFQKKQAKLVFSYITSPVYHWQNENDRTYQASSLAGEHIVQAEYMGISENCNACEAADQFISFLLSEPAQKIIMKKNVMFPISPNFVVGTEFEKISMVQILDEEKVAAIADQKEHLLTKWKELDL